MNLSCRPLLPVVLGQMLDHAAGRGAGIVDHDVAAAERLVGLLDEVLGVLVLAQVGGDRHDLAAGRLGDLLRDGIERFLRRAQIATSTPSFASASVMPLPMPSLPPVTSAVFPLSLRSMRLLLVLSVGYFGLCASQRPRSASAKNSASAALNFSGSSLVSVWPVRGTT